MKKLIILMVGVMTLASCGTTGSGAFSGAMFGGMIGSAIGGITGGPRGSDFGTLIGMATGAATGAAVEAAANNKTERRTAPDSEYYDKTGSGNDIIYMEPADNVGEYTKVPSASVEKVGEGCPIDIRNIRFIGNNQATHIAKGETASICFEIHNTSNDVITNIVPMVIETTGNKRLAVSPAILIENLGPRKALRYTAYITAKNSLKTGTARFKLSVNSGNATISNIEEIEVALN